MSFKETNERQLIIMAPTYWPFDLRSCFLFLKNTNVLGTLLVTTHLNFWVNLDSHFCLFHSYRRSGNQLFLTQHDSLIEGVNHFHGKYVPCYTLWNFLDHSFISLDTRNLLTFTYLSYARQPIATWDYSCSRC